MELPEDLLTPRPNRDLEATIRAIAEGARFLAEEQDAAARRGCAFVLIAHLNHLVESPDHLPPLLSKGSAESSGDDDWLDDDDLRRRGLSPLSARPFGEMASPSATYFIEFNGRISSLLASLPKDDDPFLGFPGSVVRIYRLDQTTAQPTTWRIEGIEAMTRVARLVRERCGEGGDRSQQILVDPRGYTRARAAVLDPLVLGSAPAGHGWNSLCELSEALRIRLVVATLVKLIDNH